MNTTVQNKGWFVFTLSALASGDGLGLLESADKEYKNPYMTDSVGVRRLNDELDVLRETGVARHSRSGWLTIEHHDLGLLQWKAGCDFKTAGWYLIVRLNGRQVLKVWPNDDGRTSPTKWEAAPDGIDAFWRGEIERMLGYLSR